MLAKKLEKTAKKQEKKLPKFSVWCSRFKTTDSKLEIVTKQLRRVFDPIDERWISVDEPSRDCLSAHENVKIMKNEGGEKE